MKLLIHDDYENIIDLLTCMVKEKGISIIIVNYLKDLDKYGIPSTLSRMNYYQVTRKINHFSCDKYKYLLHMVKKNCEEYRRRKEYFKMRSMDYKIIF